jgi:hypothetical protein
MDLQTRALVTELMGGLPDYKHYDLVWSVSVDLTADTVERIMGDGQ